MSNHWLRLWHDMPNDPKWRTISRVSKQPVSLVLSVYLHLLVDASRNVTRGHADVTTEDLASALDCDNQQIEAVLSAMEGRVKEGNVLTGWDKRQPKREDIGNEKTGSKSAAERKREQREREKQSLTSINVTQCHEESRNVTTDKEEIKRREDIKNTSYSSHNDSEIVSDEENEGDSLKLKTNPIPLQKVLDSYKEICKDVLPIPRVFTKAMQGNVRQRWAWIKKDKGFTTNEQVIEWFNEFFKMVSRNDWLCGRAEQQKDRPWRADFQWLMTERKFNDVISRKFENHQH